MIERNAGLPPEISLAAVRGRQSFGAMPQSEGIGTNIYGGRPGDELSQTRAAAESQNANQFRDRKRRAFRNSESAALSACSLP
jgi:hypothetical protein